MLRITLFFTFVAALAVAAVALWGAGITLAGPHTVQTRTVGAFSRVEVRGSADVRVRPGRARTLTVSGGRHRVDDLITRVQDGTLVVAERDTSHWIDFGDSGLTVTAHAPAIDAATIDGSGHISLPPAHGGTTRVEVNGSGGVDGSGHVDRLRAAVDGSGDLDLGGLTTRTANVAVWGSGQADVDARRSLAASVHGSGRVSYSGRPRVTRDIEGSGEVTAG